MTIRTNTPEEIRAYALQGYCLCESCDAIRRAELSPAELERAMLPAADISKLAAAYIGSLAEATLEPMTAEPARVSGEHVILDARNVDHWSRNHDR